MHKTLEPVWDEGLIFKKAPLEKVCKRGMKIIVKDADLLREETIGTLEVNLEALEDHTSLPFNEGLDPQGELKFVVRWEESELPKPQPLPPVGTGGNVSAEESSSAKTDLSPAKSDKPNKSPTKSKKSKKTPRKTLRCRLMVQTRLQQRSRFERRTMRRRRPQHYSDRYRYSCTAERCRSVSWLHLCIGIAYSSLHT